MDLYDHLNDQAQNDSTNGGGASSSQKPTQPTLNEEVQVAVNALKTSSWGSWFKGAIDDVRERGQSVIREASQEVSSLGADATNQFRSLTEHARSLTISNTSGTDPTTSGEQPESTSSSQDTTNRDGQTTPTPSSNRADETVLGYLSRAEDAADEALVKLGAGLMKQLKGIVSITSEGSEVFESRDDSGKRVIHSSLYNAQWHVLHTTEKNFTDDPPATPEFESWQKDFDIDGKTDAISADLAKYPELRASMEKLVPGRVPYADFWKRYYFLRENIETARARRQELMKAVASAEDDDDWGNSDDETAAPAKVNRPTSTESSTTIHPPQAVDSSTLLKPSEPRKSNDEKSQADSDTSYDVVGAASGVPSQAPSSPKESRKADDSDDDEWE